ncbi:hypothetical protein ACFW04_012512 [Cataglyphis niger]
MPNCFKAIDGKHIVIQAPYNTGISFFNYKKTFNIVLMAVCDAYGNASCLPGTDMKFPYYMVADEAFSLKSYIMRPYPESKSNKTQKTFNYRLSRARHVIENSFGILTSRW